MVRNCDVGRAVDRLIDVADEVVAKIVHGKAESDSKCVQRPVYTSGGYRIFRKKGGVKYKWKYGRTKRCV